MPERELTYGEKLVGIKFNPGKFTEVDEIKQRYAKSIDTIKERADKTDDEASNAVYSGAIAALVIAQMEEVKAITWSAN